MSDWQGQGQGIGCFNCPPGFYADKTGLDKCKKSPEGYIAPDKSTAPIACPKGFYSNSTTIMLYGDVCVRCPKYTFANKTASNSCEPCPNDKICPDPTQPPTNVPAGI